MLENSLDFIVILTGYTDHLLSESNINKEQLSAKFGFVNR